MAPSTRRSARKGKRPNYSDAAYFEDVDIASDEEEISDAESDGSVAPPKAKRRRVTKTARSPSLSSPSATRPAKPAKDVADVADVWHEVFEILLAGGDQATVAKCISLNKNIGSAAARLTYRGSTAHLKARQLVNRARSIFFSMSNETAFRYCDTVNELDVNDIVCSFIEQTVPVQEFYRRIVGTAVPQHVGVRDLTRADFSAMSNSVALWICGQTSHLPVLKQLEVKKLGFGIIAPTVFSDLTTLKVSASVVDKTVGELIFEGCSKLQNLAITYAYSSPKLAFRPRVQNMMPPLEDTETGNAVREFIEAFPDGHLKAFEMCLHDTSSLDQNLTAEDPVGLDYTNSRLLLQALKKQTKLESLRLARMDPAAYTDLPDLNELHDTLTTLHIVWPDRLWGSHPGLKSSPPPILLRPLIKWLKDCRNLRKLYWSSRDDKQSPRFGGHSGNWTDLIATAFPEHSHKDLFPKLEDATFFLGLDRLHVYQRIKYLKNLRFLRIITDAYYCPSGSRQRNRLKWDSEELAKSLVEHPSLESADINDANLYIGKRAFSFPRYPPKRRDYPDTYNAKLRYLSIRSDDTPHEIGMWKFVSRLTGLRHLRLETDNKWKPDDLAKFIKGSNLTKKADGGFPPRFDVGFVERESWEAIGDHHKKLVEQYLDLHLHFEVPKPGVTVNTE